MTETQLKLGNALLRSLVQLKEKNGGINIEDVGELFESMASSLTHGSNIDAYVRAEIEKMARYISHAMNEISSISVEVIAPDKLDDVENPVQNLSIAGAELSAVVKATEKATHDILDAADVIQSKLKEIKDKSSAAAVNDIGAAATKIYDACNFQDITGQRINKVLATLEFLQAKVNNLKKLFDENADNFVPEASGGIRKDTRKDAKLMAGPQLKGPSQDQIDKLFANLK